MTQLDSLKKLKKWVLTDLKLEGYEHQIIADKIDEHIKEFESQDWDDEHGLDLVLNDMISDFTDEEIDQLMSDSDFDLNK